MNTNNPSINALGLFQTGKTVNQPSTDEIGSTTNNTKKPSSQQRSSIETNSLLFNSSKDQKPQQNSTSDDKTQKSTDDVKSGANIKGVSPDQKLPKESVQTNKEPTKDQGGILRNNLKQSTGSKNPLVGKSEPNSQPKDLGSKNPAPSANIQVEAQSAGCRDILEALKMPSNPHNSRHTPLTEKTLKKLVQNYTKYMVSPQVPEKKSFDDICTIKKEVKQVGSKNQTSEEYFLKIQQLEPLQIKEKKMINLFWTSVIRKVYKKIKYASFGALLDAVRLHIRSNKDFYLKDGTINTKKFSVHELYPIINGVVTINQESEFHKRVCHETEMYALDFFKELSICFGQMNRLKHTQERHFGNLFQELSRGNKKSELTLNLITALKQVFILASEQSEVKHDRISEQFNSEQIIGYITSSLLSVFYTFPESFTNDVTKNLLETLERNYTLLNSPSNGPQYQENLQELILQLFLSPKRFEDCQQKISYDKVADLRTILKSNLTMLKPLKVLCLVHKKAYDSKDLQKLLIEASLIDMSEIIWKRYLEQLILRWIEDKNDFLQTNQKNPDSALEAQVLSLPEEMIQNFIFNKMNKFLHHNAYVFWEGHFNSFEESANQFKSQIREANSEKIDCQAKYYQNYSVFSKYTGTLVEIMQHLNQNPKNSNGECRQYEKNLLGNIIQTACGLMGFSQKEISELQDISENPLIGKDSSSPAKSKRRQVPTSLKDLFKIGGQPEPVNKPYQFASNVYSQFAEIFTNMSSSQFVQILKAQLELPINFNGSERTASSSRVHQFVLKVLTAEPALILTDFSQIFMSTEEDPEYDVSDFTVSERHQADQNASNNQGDGEPVKFISSPKRQRELSQRRQLECQLRLIEQLVLNPILSCSSHSADGFQDELKLSHITLCYDALNSLLLSEDPNAKQLIIRHLRSLEQQNDNQKAEMGTKFADRSSLPQKIKAIIPLETHIDGMLPSSHNGDSKQEYHKLITQHLQILLKLNLTGLQWTKQIISRLGAISKREPLRSAGFYAEFLADTFSYLNSVIVRGQSVQNEFYQLLADLKHLLNFDFIVLYIQQCLELTQISQPNGVNSLCNVLLLQENPDACKDLLEGVRLLGALLLWFSLESSFQSKKGEHEHLSSTIGKNGYVDGKKSEAQNFVPSHIKQEFVPQHSNALWSDSVFSADSGVNIESPVLLASYLNRVHIIPTSYSSNSAEIYSQDFSTSYFCALSTILTSATDEQRFLLSNANSRYSSNLLECMLQLIKLYPHNIIRELFRVINTQNFDERKVWETNDKEQRHSTTGKSHSFNKNDSLLEDKQGEPMELKRFIAYTEKTMEESAIQILVFGGEKVCKWTRVQKVVDEVRANMEKTRYAKFRKDKQLKILSMVSRYFFYSMEQSHQFMLLTGENEATKSSSATQRDAKPKFNQSASLSNRDVYAEQSGTTPQRQVNIRDVSAINLTVKEIKEHFTYILEVILEKLQPFVQQCNHQFNRSHYQERNSWEFGKRPHKYIFQQQSVSHIIENVYSGLVRALLTNRDCYVRWLRLSHKLLFQRANFHGVESLRKAASQYALSKSINLKAAKFCEPQEPFLSKSYFDLLIMFFNCTEYMLGAESKAIIAIEGLDSNIEHFLQFLVSDVIHPFIRQAQDISQNHPNTLQHSFNTEAEIALKPFLTGGQILLQIFLSGLRFYESLTKDSQARTGLYEMLWKSLTTEKRNLDRQQTTTEFLQSHLKTFTVIMMEFSHLLNKPLSPEKINVDNIKTTWPLLLSPCCLDTEKCAQNPLNLLFLLHSLSHKHGTSRSLKHGQNINPEAVANSVFSDISRKPLYEISICKAIRSILSSESVRIEINPYNTRNLFPENSNQPNQGVIRGQYLISILESNGYLGQSHQHSHLIIINEILSLYEEQLLHGIKVRNSHCNVSDRVQSNNREIWMCEFLIAFLTNEEISYGLDSPGQMVQITNKIEQFLFEADGLAWLQRFGHLIAKLLHSTGLRRQPSDSANRNLSGRGELSEDSHLGSLSSEFKGYRGHSKSKNIFDWMSLPFKSQEFTKSASEQSSNSHGLQQMTYVEKLLLNQMLKLLTLILTTQTAEQFSQRDSGTGSAFDSKNLSVSRAKVKQYLLNSIHEASEHLFSKEFIQFDFNRMTEAVVADIENPNCNSTELEKQLSMLKISELCNGQDISHRIRNLNSGNIKNSNRLSNNPTSTYRSNGGSHSLQNTESNLETLLSVCGDKCLGMLHFIEHIEILCSMSLLSVSCEQIGPQTSEVHRPEVVYDQMLKMSETLTSQLISLVANKSSLLPIIDEFGEQLSQIVESNIAMDPKNHSLTRQMVHFYHFQFQLQNGRSCSMSDLSTGLNISYESMIDLISDSLEVLYGELHERNQELKEGLYRFETNRAELHTGRSQLRSERQQFNSAFEKGDQFGQQKELDRRKEAFMGMVRKLKEHTGKDRVTQLKWLGDSRYDVSERKNMTRTLWSQTHKNMASNTKKVFFED